MYKKFMKTSLSMIRQSILQFYSLLWVDIRLFFDVMLDELAVAKIKHDCNVCGRSMIEMLGVLAIIGVLSVGGLAGYSKAMEKWKINRIIADYNSLVYGLLEYKPKIRGGSGEINGLAVALDLVPNTWKKADSNSDNFGGFTDSMGNRIRIGYRAPNTEGRDKTHPENEGVYIDYSLGTIKHDEKGVLKAESFSEKICFELFNNVIKPLHSVVNAGWVNTGKNYYHGSFYYGDNYCSANRPCLRDITLNQIKSICLCDKLSSCNVTIIF